MTYYETKRLLERFWRTEGNPRLKGLLLAGLDGGPSAETVGQAWPGSAEHREHLLSQVPSVTGNGRVLKARATERYTPGAHEDFEQQRESATARTLARDEFSDDEMDRFLSGAETMDKDQYIKRALLQNEVNELDVLFREELATTIIQGAAPRKIAREAANVINVSRRKGDLPRGSDQYYAEKTTSGDVIGTGETSFDTVAFECDKYGAGWEIEKELARESEVDTMEFLIRETGAAVENAVNRVFLNNLVDNAGQEHDTGGSNQDVTMVNEGIEKVELQNFVADSAVMHSEFKTDLFEDSNLAYANQAGSDDVIRQREFNPLFGLEMFTMSPGTHNTTNQTWGFDADGEIGAVVYQRDHAALVIWDEFDMETEDYDDPLRDLRGGNVRIYVDSVFRQADSAARVEY